MMEAPRTYASAGAFRRALEDRLKSASQSEQTDLNRLRRQVSFDRLLARLFRIEPAPWALKGGYALELLLKQARATIDIDLTMQRPATVGADAVDTNRAVREMLQNAAGVSLGDWFEYTIGPAVVDLDAAPYGGARYPVEARMDARIFAWFHLDVGIGDVVMQPLEVVECRDWLRFGGIGRPRVRMISREQQIAEKLHAYTLPRSAPNSRVKDLVDLALLIGSARPSEKRVVDALCLTFERRKTHLIPSTLSPPPGDWQRRFRVLAEECGLSRDMASAFADVRSFFDRVSAGDPKG
jgi:hypothetical protein